VLLRGLFLAIVMMLARSAPIHAQDPVRETVVVTGHAAPEPFKNLSRAVVVITQAQIRRLPVRSVAEVLAYLSSIDVQSRGAHGVQSDFSIRGAAFGRTLVLVNGVRINDAQSGHHNSDIPALLDDVDRIEVLYGSGSSLYGADAFGGTINVITRSPQKLRRQFSASTGQFGFVDAGAALDVVRSSVAEAISISASRSSGFMPARDFETLAVSSRTGLGERASLLVSHLRKDFGANGFYGPAPSHERTNQTFVVWEQRLRDIAAWQASQQTSYRTHGDWFLYDPRTSGAVANRHRTHAVESTLKLQRVLSERGRLHLGGTAGAEWIRSNNLGDHAFARGSVFAELQRRVGTRTLIYPGLRLDGYSNFGASLSPSLSIGSWVSPRVKARAAIGRAFRSPTFTELYYRDPNNEGTPTLKPEHAWEAEAGADWLMPRGLQATGSVFFRREQNVIDWIRQSVSERWRTTNIRRIDARGFELGVSHLTEQGGLVRLDYAYLDADAGAVDFLSKYVLDYARHTVTLSSSLPLPASMAIGHRLAYKQRLGRGGYWVADGRVSRRIGSADLFVEVSNLLDTDYQEISGVDVPGRWVKAGVHIGPR
jgi:iron complex outermembrane receptor protein